MLEIHLGVDNNYRSLYQRDVGLLRQNTNIYWNLIFYFQMTDLPCEFIKPYEETAFMADALQQEMSKLRLTQLVRRYGYEHIEVAGSDPALRKTRTHDLSGKSGSKLISPTAAAAAARHRDAGLIPSPRAADARNPGGRTSPPIAELPNPLIQSNSGVIPKQPGTRSPFKKLLSNVQHAGQNLVTRMHSPRAGAGPRPFEGKQGDPESNRQTNTTRRVAFKQAKMQSQSYSRDELDM